MSDTDQPPPGAVAAMQASIGRLANAGLLEIVEYDDKSDRGIFRFHPGYHRLLMAGRNPLMEESFARPLAAGDLAAVRQWIEREDAMLQRVAGSYDGGHTDG